MCFKSTVLCECFQSLKASSAKYQAILRAISQDNCTASSAKYQVIFRAISQDNC